MEISGVFKSARENKIDKFFLAKYRELIIQVNQACGRFHIFCGACVFWTSETVKLLCGGGQELNHVVTYL